MSKSNFYAADRAEESSLIEQRTTARTGGLVILRRGIRAWINHGYAFSGLGQTQDVCDARCAHLRWLELESEVSGVKDKWPLSKYIRKERLAHISLCFTKPFSSVLSRGIRSPYPYSLMRRILLLSALAAYAAAQIKICPLGGPIFPAAQRPGGSAAMKQATRNFTESLHEMLYPANASLTTAIDPDLTSFAVQVYSARDSKPLLEYYHTATSARNNILGVNRIDGDTVFRIGSCSKIWTVLLLLMETGEALFHEPVWKYFPEVEHAIKELDGGLNEIDHVHWEDVTIGDLVSQTAGLERSCQ